MAKLKRTSVQTTVAGGLLALTLAGCAASAPAAAPSPTASPAASAEPDRVDPAVQVVTDYLEAVAADDTAAAWAMLSPETQAIHASEQGYADAQATDRVVSANDAGVLLGGELVSYPVPGSAVMQVTASLSTTAAPGTVAEAWIVRDTEAGPRIDDVGLPSTGQTPYTWVNPDLDEGVPFDPAEQPRVYFPRVFSGTEVMANPPETITAWLDGVPSTVTLDVAAGSGAEFVVDSPAAVGQLLTVAWVLDPASPLWRTTTIVL
jgi:hypothetical protein